MRKFVLMSLAALALAGCQTVAERQAQERVEDDLFCQEIGAKRGSPAYIKCRTDLVQARAQAAAASRPVVVTTWGWGFGGYCRSTPWGVRCY
jgi:ABC-type glycerol-3-phosphate transport system substrate-binding protein